LASVVSGRGLAAAVQDDDERRRARQRLRHKGEHLERAGIGAELTDLDQRTAARLRGGSAIHSHTIEPVQFRELAEEFDVLREGQRWLLVRLILLTRLKPDSCCTAK
jgi:hypothetical protein